jgi:hypothetical protein
MLRRVSIELHKDEGDGKFTVVETLLFVRKDRVILDDLGYDAASWYLLQVVGFEEGIPWTKKVGSRC